MTDLSALIERMPACWREIAAKMIEARHASIDGDSDPDTLLAAAFIFDEGIFFLPEDVRAEVVVMLRKPADAALLTSLSQEPQG